MTAATVPPPNQEALAYAGESASGFARKLREETLACRVRVWKMGTRRALTTEQKEGLAEAYHANVKALSASKRLLDTKHPAYKRVRGILANAKGYWKGVSVPYPEPGVRLIRRSRVTQFTEQLAHYRGGLEDALIDLAACYEELRGRAMNDLGDLFSPADYPSRIDHEFALDWDFPSIAPPEYLKDIHPELYAQEQARIQGRFEESVRLAEESFILQFHDLVARMAERLRGDVDGKAKVIRTSTVENLKGFFEQFRDLDIGSSGQLAALVDQAEALMGGQDVEGLRVDGELRASIGNGLAEVEQAIASLAVDRGLRQIELPPEAPPPEVPEGQAGDDAAV